MLLMAYGKYPSTFDALTAVDATSKALWGLFATWLSTGYVTNKNRAAGVEEKFLDPNTAVSYLRVKSCLPNYQKRKTCCG